MKLEYKIYRADTIKKLEIFVKNKIKDGWRPQGGVSSCIVATEPERKMEYTQALIRGKA